eukprot:1159715-Pelagomonas_calceolata.AAC.5
MLGPTAWSSDCLAQKREYQGYRQRAKQNAGSSMFDEWLPGSEKETQRAVGGSMAGHIENIETC